MAKLRWLLFLWQILWLVTVIVCSALVPLWAQVYLLIAVIINIFIASDYRKAGVHMKAYTDYPFESLGDKAGEKAPIREIEILSYDGNKYCKIMVEGKIEELKAGYIYESRGRYGEVSSVPQSILRKLC